MPDNALSALPSGNRRLALRDRLSSRHASFTVVVALIVGLCFGFVEFLLDLPNERSRIEETIQLILDTASEPAAAAAYAIDRPLSQRIANRLVSHSFVVSARIRDNFTHTLGEAERAGASSSRINLTRHLVAPLGPYDIPLYNRNPLGQSSLVGELMVQIDNRIITQGLQQRLLRMVVLSLVRAIVIAALIALVFHFLTSKPLLSLAETVANISPTEPVPQLVTVRPRHERDELGIIAKAVNRLVLAFRTTLQEREEISAQLRQLAATLELRVQERTQELASSNENLRLAMERLVASEKLASLGQLVAGVAHELNTPLGNMLTVSTTLQERVEQFHKVVSSGAIRRSVIDGFVEDTQGATRLLVRSGENAARLIRNFKQVAVDQASFGRRRFALAKTVEETLSSLHNKLKKQPITIDVRIPEDLIMDNHPGPIEQILTNFVLNSLLHAFEPDQPGHILIQAQARDEQVELVYQDDGCGMSRETAQQAFNPFFSTRFGQGGSGLGLTIVHNLVTGVLHGTIQMKTEPGQGTRFTLSLPMNGPESPESLGSQA